MGGECVLPASEVFQELDRYQINYKVVHHPAVYTTEEADRFFKTYDFAKVRNLFLDNKDHFYLVMIDDQKRLDMKKLRKQLQTRRFSFASQEALEKVMGIKNGAVSPFNLLNDEQHQVKLVIDQTIVDENDFIGCHPNDNTQTVILKINDLLKLIQRWGYEVTVLPL